MADVFGESDEDDNNDATSGKVTMATYVVGKTIICST